MKYFSHKERKSESQVQHEVYNDDECLRGYLDWQTRAATAPAMTTVPGWAQELVQQTYTAFMDILYPAAIFPRLAGMGLSLSFGRAGRIIIPTRATTPTIAGSFVGKASRSPSGAAVH